MKSLLEFKNDKVVVEEEKTDYSKFDILVRAGLANKAQMQRIHKILDKMQDERPVFNPVDRQIMQNIFNKMVDLISNNKMIHQQARRAVREEVSAEDFIELDSFENLDENKKDDPPFVLMLKRKAIRLYPDKTKVALYYNKQLDKYFSVPYGKNIDQPVMQSESVELEESVMDQLHKIVKDKQSGSVKFGNGQSRKVDGYTASAITQVHNALNDDNKKKIADMVHKSPAHFEKVANFAFSKVK
jgi:hypothetical protein